MQNFTTTADAEALDGVSDATTPEVEAYQAPEADSSEINDWTVRFDDVLYHLPVPVSELLDHDWTVNTKESDTAVLNGKYGYVTLEKGGQKLYCTVHNYGAEATTVRNCFVTSLYGDLDTTKIPISITNGITLGTSESDFLAKAGDAKSEKTEKEDSNLTLYTFYSDDEKLDYTEVGIDNDLKLVRSIKVVHNQPEAPEEEAKKLPLKIHLPFPTVRNRPKHRLRNDTFRKMAAWQLTTDENEDFYGKLIRRYHHRLRPGGSFCRDLCETRKALLSYD